MSFYPSSTCAANGSDISSSIDDAKPSSIKREPKINPKPKSSMPTTSLDSLDNASSLSDSKSTSLSFVKGSSGHVDRALLISSPSHNPGSMYKDTDKEEDRDHIKAVTFSLTAIKREDDYRALSHFTAFMDPCPPLPMCNYSISRLEAEDLSGRSDVRSSKEDSIQVYYTGRMKDFLNSFDKAFSRM